MFGYIYKKDVAIIAVVLAFCLLVGSFFDYQISSALFNSSSLFGRFVEAAGELPFELTASVAGVMLVRSARPDSKASKWLAALGILINVAQFSAVVGNRQPRQVELYRGRRNQGRL